MGLGARFAGLDGPDAGVVPGPPAGRQDPRRRAPDRAVGAGPAPSARPRGLRRRGARLLGVGGALAGHRGLPAHRRLRPHRPARRRARARRPVRRAVPAAHRLSPAPVTSCRAPSCGRCASTSTPTAPPPTAPSRRPTLVRAAAAAGLDVVALTDHDTTAAGPRRPTALPAGLRLVRGAEISCVVRRRQPAPARLPLRPGDAALAEEMAMALDDRVPRAQGDRRASSPTAGYPISWDDVLASSQPGATVGPAAHRRRTGRRGRRRPTATRRSTDAAAQRQRSTSSATTTSTRSGRSGWCARPAACPCSPTRRPRSAA